MNYGSLGSLSASSLQPGDFEFAYAREVFSAFCLNHESKLHGLYYPCPQDKEDLAYKEASLKHDFVITPIPPELWKVSARIHVFIKNRPGTLNELCQFFKEKRVSIIHSESTRSAFRYATWSLHIVFEELLDKELHFDEEKSCYTETLEKLEKLKTQLESERQAHLFFPASDSKHAVHGHPNYTLSYFANYIDDLPEDPLRKTFTLTVNDPDRSHRRQRLVGNTDFTNIMTSLLRDNKALLPATTFSEIDTNELNLRTTLIPKNDSNRFFKVSMKYECNEQSNAVPQRETYVGIMHDITKHMPAHFNIWHSYDRTLDNKPSEKGEMVFLIENISQFLMHDAPRVAEIKTRLDPDQRDANSYQQEAINWFKNIGYRHEKSGGIYQFYEFSVSPLPTAGVIKETFLHDGREGGFEYDVFISYSQKDKEADSEQYIENLLRLFDKHGISYHLDTKEIETGERLDQSLLDNIKNSREMCVTISANTLESDWMTVERGAAWILGKTITPYIIEGQKEKLPQLLGMNKYVKADDDKSVQQYIEDIIARRDRYLSNKYRHVFFK